MSLDGLYPIIEEIEEMKQITQYEGKRVIVLGLARTGISTAKLLKQLGADVIINDQKQADEAVQSELENLGITVISGYHPLEMVTSDIAFLFKSPGIPYENEMVASAIKQQIPVLTDVELAWEVSEAPIIGITGTNGKTTTTMMIEAIFNYHQSQHALLAGNIGIPSADVARVAKPSQEIVMELSSFQLMGIENFTPEIAVIVNIYEAHLDYHHTREAYQEAKWKIQQNMTAANHLVMNFNEVEWQELAKTTKATVVPFSTKEVVKDGAYLLDQRLYFKDEFIMEASELGVPGEHNIENALAAIATARLKGIPRDEIRTVLSRFSGARHRLEYVGEYQQVKYYNDSKATNILATQKALSGFDNQHLILIAGGLDRGNAFTDLVPDLKGLKALVLMGENKEKIQSAAIQAGIDNIIMVETMAEAVKQAIALAEAQDSILLSPASASWDQYKTFEERGEDFVSALKKYQQEEQ